VAATDLFVRALGTEPAGLADETTERILDAALAEAAANGVERITMDAVAGRARVGRMTVYRRFGSKPELVTALVGREASRGLAAIATAVDPGRELPDRVADGFIATLQVARAHPLLQRLVRYEPQTLLAALNDPGDPLLAMLREFGVAQIQAAGPAEGELRAGPEEIAELLVRIGLTYLLIPAGVIDLDDEHAARRLAETLIAPIVVADPA
jgi:AcrR family transcriptional regulator